MMCPLFVDPGCGQPQPTQTPTLQQPPYPGPVLAYPPVTCRIPLFRSYAYREALGKGIPGIFEGRNLACGALLQSRL